MSEALSRPIEFKPSVAIPKQPAKQTAEVPFEFSKSEEDKNIPIALYEQRYHKPYAAEFFGMDRSFLLNLETKTIGQLREIDEFILEQMDQMDLKDNKKSYNKVLNKLLDLIGVDENEKSLNKVGKVISLIQIRRAFK